MNEREKEGDREGENALLLSGESTGEKNVEAKK